MLEFIKIVCVLFYNFIEFIILISWCKEYMIWRILFSKFLGVLPACTCVRAIGNLWSTCLGVNVLIPSP